MGFDRNAPHNHLPPLPPAVDLETPRILKSLVEARVAVERLRGQARTLPNQDVLLRALTLREASISSEIENIVTTNDELYRAFDQDPVTAEPETKEVLRYSEAIWQAFGRLEGDGGFSVALFEEIASVVNGTPTRVRTGTGTRIVRGSIGEVVYTPPVGGGRIEGMLSDVARFLGRKDGIDPLVKVALAHYQFEAIHPFADGNGRTGRILAVLGLVSSGLIERPVLYLSEPLLSSRRRYFLQRYYDGLREVTEEGRWEDWVVYMLEVVTAAAHSTTSRIDRIVKIVADWREQTRRALPREYREDLLAAVFSQPVTRIETLVRAGVGNRQTASRHLKALVRAGLLEEHREWRDAVFINRALLDAMTAEVEP